VRGEAVLVALRSPGTLAVVDERGRLDHFGAAVPVTGPVIEAAWVGPALHDAHVHLAFGSYAAMLAGAVTSVRDLGAPLADALRWRSEAVAVAGPVLTAPGGYPSSGWGAAGFAQFLHEPAAAVRALVGAGVDVVKVALEPAGGQPVPSRDDVREVVRAAHDAGLAVTAHALTVAMVERALDAGVDELAHIPVEPLPADLVERLAAIPVVSTIETLTGYPRSAVTANAAALVAAGGRLRYGTDLGNAGTRSGADPRELDRLADAGLGRAGALAAASEPVVLGGPARLAALDADPLVDPSAWTRPLAVVSARSVHIAPR
jgi:imidazolonepropionase-like amidohydrolase